MTNYYAIVLAGGGGTRLWPVSRKKAPKQLLSIVGDHTMIEYTYTRLRRLFEADHIVIVPTKEYGNVIRKQLGAREKYHIIEEPAPRGTAGAIALAVAWIAERDPNAMVVTINSDAHVGNEERYIETVRALPGVIQQHSDLLTLVGLIPQYPETGYGYIECTKRVTTKTSVVAVKQFVEKPDLTTAKQYVRSGRFLWNPTMIGATVKTFWSRFQEHLPKHAQAIEQYHSHRHSNAAYLRLDPISIDYGILEREKNMQAVVARDWVWSDIGHWKAVKDVQSVRSDENVGSRHVTTDAKGNLLLSTNNKLIAAVGVRNLAVIDTDDVILVCPLNRAQDVKRIIEELKKQGLTKYL